MSAPYLAAAQVMSRAPSIFMMASSPRAAAGGHGHGGDTHRSGLLSRAVSMAQVRTRMSGPGGLEMMAIHPEPSQMEQDPDKPLHLQHFTCEWVGRPGLPLCETERLRLRQTDPWAASGIVHTVTDPKYEQRAQGMLEARVTREQHVAALQLQYQAERRQEARAARARGEARRQDLQAASGQAMARARTLGAGLGLGGSGGTALPPLDQPSSSLQQHAAGRSGSAPARSGSQRRGARGSGHLLPAQHRTVAPPGSHGAIGIAVALDEVLGHGHGTAVGGWGGGGAGTRGPACTWGAGSTKPLVQELQEALDVGSRLPRSSFAAGRGQIRFG